MKNAKWHILFWFVYFWMAYTIDRFIDPFYTTVFKELIFFLFQNIFLFYGVLIVLRHFSVRSKAALAFSILQLLLVYTAFICIRYFIRYKFMAYYFDKRYAELAFSAWLPTCFTWIINSTVYSLGYTYAQSSIRKQKQLLESQKEKAKMEQEKLILENAHLRAQINPHFLFNTLSYFHNKLLRIDPALADGIVALSGIMRAAIRQPNETGTVSLKDEISSIEHLISIYRMRFSNGVYINFDNKITYSPGLNILPHILITLVENAMKHGELYDPENPLIISMGIDSGMLHFKVRNKKRNEPREVSHGIGVRYILSQLEYTYKHNSSLKISDEAHFYTVTLCIAIKSMQDINPTAIETPNQVLYH